MDTVAELLRKNIRAKMTAVGLDQKSLAAALEVKPPVVSRMLSPEGSAPTVDTLERIAGALDTTPWQLLQPEGAKPSPDPDLARLALIGRITVVHRRASPADKLQALLDFAESLADPPPAKLPSDPAKPHKQVK
jgi:transcriptional regulator with XRE-family HTH domain